MDCPKRSAHADLAHEEGFSLIEAIVAVAIFSVAAGGMLSATLAVMRPIADSRWNAQLTSVAQNVLADVRAASAYDTSVIAYNVGQQNTFSVPNLGASLAPGSHVLPPPYQVVVSYWRKDANSPVHAIVRVADAQQHLVQVDGVLAQEAPAPGSIVSPQPSLNLASPPPPAPVQTPIYIQLQPDIPPTQAEGSGGM